MKFKNLDKLLPLGYLLLVVLGIVKESVFYYLLNINILKYTSIMDVLLSPIADLTSHPLILMAFLFYLGALYLCGALAGKNTDKKWVKSLLGVKPEDQPLPAQVLQERLGSKFLGILSFGIISFFLGIGIGNGLKVSKRIKTGNITYDYSIRVDNQEEKKIYLIGNNSSNFIYIEQGNPHIKISPTSAIKTITFLNENRRK